MKNSAYWFPTIIWAGFIFYLSTLYGVDLPPFPYSDKIAHICIYTVMGYFIMMALIKVHNLDATKAVVLAIILAAVYGVSDEIHQMYVPTRSADVFDLISDIVGGFLGAVIYGFVPQIYKKA